MYFADKKKKKNCQTLSPDKSEKHYLNKVEIAML